MNAARPLGAAVLLRGQSNVTTLPNSIFYKRHRHRIVAETILQMNSTNDRTTEALLGRVRSFCFPGGDAVR